MPIILHIFTCFPKERWGLTFARFIQAVIVLTSHSFNLVTRESINFSKGKINAFASLLPEAHHYHIRLLLEGGWEEGWEFTQSTSFQTVPKKRQCVLKNQANRHEHRGPASSHHLCHLRSPWGLFQRTMLAGKLAHWQKANYFLTA